MKRLEVTFDLNSLAFMQGPFELQRPKDMQSSVVKSSIDTGETSAEVATGRRTRGAFEMAGLWSTVPCDGGSVFTAATNPVTVPGGPLRDRTRWHRWKVGAMSALRIGREAAGPDYRLYGSDEPEWKKFVDRLTKYIPGDAIIGYTAIITLFTSTAGVPEPQLIWALVFLLVVTPALVILGYLLAPNHTGLGAIAPDIALGIVAFAVWSVTVPGNGWLDWSVVGDNPKQVAGIGIVIGIFMPLVAKLLGRDTGG